MNDLLLKPVTAIFGCLLLILPPTDTAVGADVGTDVGTAQWDPTKPSSEIESRLAAGNPVKNLQKTTLPSTANRVASCPLQLRGMVMRDRDHGTAFVSVGDGRAQLVKLHRITPGRPGQQISRDQISRDQISRDQISLGGVNFVVADFNETQIVLQTVDGLRRCIIQ